MDNYTNLTPPELTPKNTIYDLMITPPEGYKDPTYSPYTQQEETPKENNNNDVVDVARQFIGTNYSYGGMSPKTGFDCSGLIKYSYKQMGIDLPRTAKEMEKIGTEVSLQNVKPGDLICTPGTGPSGKHVKMVSKIDNGQIYVIEAIGKKYGIKEHLLKRTDNITTIRRVGTQFNNRQEYAKTMYNYLYKALENNGLDGETWAPILVAHTSIESNWGNNFSKRHNNFAGIKGKGSGQVGTKEWSPTKGYYSTTSSFKSYPNISAFADDYVKKLKNRFNVFSGSPQQFLYNLKNKNYFTAKLSDYQNMMNSRLKIVNNLLNG